MAAGNFQSVRMAEFWAWALNLPSSPRFHAHPAATRVACSENPPSLNRAITCYDSNLIAFVFPQKVLS